MPTAEQLAKWLEDDGHAGCADELLRADPECRPGAAREAADCMEKDADGYHDKLYEGLITELREWADEQEKTQ